MSVRVLIADDHEVVRSGLISLLSGSDVEIVAEATNGKEAVSLAQETNPDVVLLDIRMPVQDGLSALESLRAVMPEIPIVMLSTYDNPTYMARALALGANDYLLKGSPREKLVESIKAVATGEPAPPSDHLQRIAGAMETTQVIQEDDLSLTKRETQVLRHIALGLSNKEIGRSLAISIETVKEHVQNILRKINATDRTQAAVWAVRKGFV